MTTLIVLAFFAYSIYRVLWGYQIYGVVSNIDEIEMLNKSGISILLDKIDFNGDIKYSLHSSMGDMYINAELQSKVNRDGFIYFFNPEITFKEIQENGAPYNPYKIQDGLSKIAKVINNQQSDGSHKALTTQWKYWSGGNDLPEFVDDNDIYGYKNIKMTNGRHVLFVAVCDVNDGTVIFLIKSTNR